MPTNTNVLALPSADAIRQAMKPHATALLVIAIAFLVIGSAAIIFPGIATLVVESFIGWLMIFSGILYGVFAFRVQGAWKIAGTVAMALLSIATGAILLLYPLQGIVTVTLVLAAYFIVIGVLRAIDAIRHRGANHWGWALASALASLILGVIIYLGFPGTAVWTLGLLFGIDLIFYGWSLIGLRSTIQSA